MPALPFLHPTSPRPAIIDDASGQTWTHAQLSQAVTTRAAELCPQRRSLVLCRCATDLDTIVNYLAALTAGHAVILVDDAMQPERLAELRSAYLPRIVLAPGAEPHLDADAPDHALHPELALMLTTSGSTGSPKLVRLALRNLRANAAAICDYLAIDDAERAIASLPLHYSYGLSVLHSHLLAQASLVLPADDLGRPGFWDCFERHACTSFAGVPFSYAIIERTGWRRRALPSLRTMTQAGGRLEPESKLALAGELASRGARLVVMYGQTEATARIAYVPPERLSDKPSAVGVAIPGGELSVRGDDGRPASPGQEGEIHYRGPNVMLGYASSPDHLARGDELHGELATGDLGYVDEDGFVHVTGRSSRFAKAYGHRVSLDDIERHLGGDGRVAALAGGAEQIAVWLEEGRDPAAARRDLAAAFGLPSRTFDVRALHALPRTRSGKIDYPALTAARA